MNWDNYDKWKSKKKNNNDENPSIDWEKYDLKSSIGLDSLEDDISKLDSSFSDYSGKWQNSEKMDSYLSQMNDVRSRLTNYRDYLQKYSPDKNQDITKIDDYIDSLNTNYSALGETKNSYSNFKTEDEYNAAKKEYGYSQKYAGMSYDEIQQLLKKHTVNDGASRDLYYDDGEEDWLKTYADSIKYKDYNIDDLQKMRDDAKKAMDENDDGLIQKISNKLFLGDANYYSRGYIDEYNELDAAYKQKKFENAAYNKNADFAEKSVYSGEKLNVMDFSNLDVNNPSDVAQYLSTPENRRGASQDGFSKFDYTSEDEKNNLNYLLNTGDEQGAKEYIEYLSPQLNERMTSKIVGENGEFAEKHPVVGSIWSAATNLGSSSSYGEDLINEFNGKPIDVNSESHLAGHVTREMRGKIGEIAGDTDALGGVFKTELFGKPLGEIIYGAGTSVADMAIDFAIGNAFGLGGQAAGNVTQAIMSSQAVAAGIVDAKQKGFSDSQAVTIGTINGAVEWLTEKYSIEAFLGNPQKALAYLAKNVVSEGSEEAFADVLNAIAEYGVAGEQSEFATAMKRYKSEGKTEKDAFLSAAKDLGMQMGSDFLAGAMAGGVMGTVGKTRFNIAEKNAYANPGKAVFKNGNLGALIEAGEAAPANTSFHQAAEALASSKNVTNTDIGKLQALAEQYAEQNTARVSEYAFNKSVSSRLEALGISGAENKKNTEIVVRAFNGETLAPEEERILNDSKQTGRVLQELNSTKTGQSESYSTAWLDGIHNNEQIKQSAEEQKRIESFVQRAKVNISENGITTKDIDTVKTVKNGVEINGQKSGDVSFADEKTASVVAYSQEYGNLAKTFIDTYNIEPAEEVSDFAFGYNTAFTYGKTDGISLDYALNSGVSSLLSHEQITAAYKAGEVAAQENKTAYKKRRSGKKPKGIVRMDKSINYKNLSEKQKASVRSIRNIAELTGITFEFFASDVDGSGNYVGENGSYLDGVIRLDIHAGKNNVFSGDVAILSAASHELTHFLNEYDQSGYKKLQNFVLTHIDGYRGKSLDALVEEKMGQYAEQGKDIEFEDAVEEITADACSVMLKDSKAMEALARTNKSLALPIIDFLKKLFEDIRASYKNVYLQDEAKAMLNYMDELQTIWDESLVNATNNFKTNQAIKNTNTESEGVKYSFGGEKAKTANIQNLSKAKEMIENGADSETVRKETGWFKGYDGKWRFEINNKDISFIRSGYYSGGIHSNEKVLQNYIKHDALFDAYPQLRNISVIFKDLGNTRGEYHSNTENDPYSVSQHPSYISIHKKMDAKETVKTLIHEIQHAVQHIEGFATGSSPEYWSQNPAYSEKGERNGINQYTLYRNTAGEVEARDAANRIDYTDEQRKNTRPDIDRKDVVFAEDGWVTFFSASKYNPETAGIREQINNSLEQLNNMDIVFEQQVPTDIKTKYDAAQWGIQELKSFGNQIDRKNFGVISFSEKDIRAAMEYADTPAEKAAIVAVPKVLKRGIKIGEHNLHKLRSKSTITFAAPVSLNGIRGNMAVVVNTNGNRYSVHRIVMPDGNVFLFNKKGTKQESYQGVPNVRSLADTTSSVPIDIINQNDSSVNTQFMQNSEKNSLRNYSDEQVREIKSHYKGRIHNIIQQKNSRIEQTRKQGQERVKQIREQRDKTAEILKIRNRLSEFGRRLANPTMKKYIPDSCREAVTELLNAFTYDTKQERSIENCLRRFQSEYENIRKNDSPAFDENIMDAIGDLSNEIKDKTLREMSLTELKNAYRVIRMVSKWMSDLDKLYGEIKRAGVEITANQILRDLIPKTAKDKKARSDLAKMLKDFGYKTLKPYALFDLIGSDALTELYKSLRNGEDVWANDVYEANVVYKRAVRKYGYRTWDTEAKRTIHTERGNIQLTLEQIMFLYAASKREQYIQHLTDSGFIYEDGYTITVDKKGKKVEIVPKGKPHPLNLSELQFISSLLTTKQKAFVDELQSYLSNEVSEKGNEVSRALYDIDRFREKNYWPIISAKNYLTYFPQKEGEMISRKSSGFAKDTVRGANNPVMLGNFSQIFSKHTENMANYHASVLPMENFNRVFGYKNLIPGELSESVRTTIQDAYGTEAVNAITNLLNDINGGVRNNKQLSLFKRMVSNFKKVAVFASLSVTVQQPSAIVRAMQIVDSKYFIQTLLTKRDYEECMKYAPVAKIKRIGYFDTSISRRAADWIIQLNPETFKEKIQALFSKDSDYRDEVLSMLPGKADEFTWAHIWNAVKLEVKDKGQYKDGSDAYYKACGERFTEVITRTQVYDSVFSKPEIMRTKDGLADQVTAFMSEPLTSLNMIINGFVTARRTGGAKGARYLGRTVAVYVATCAFNAILKSFVTASRDDDDDETYLEKYIGEFFANSLDSLNPLTLVPYVRDIISLFDGYNVDRSDLTAFSDFAKAIKTAFDSEKPINEKAEKLSYAIASFFGIPLRNVMRDVKGIFNVISSEPIWETTGDGIKDAVFGKNTADENAKEYGKLILKGKTSNAAALLEKMKNDKIKMRTATYPNESEQEREKEVKSALRSSFTSHYKPLYFTGSADEKNNIRIIMGQSGLYGGSSDIHKTCKQWEEDYKEQQAKK